MRGERGAGLKAAFGGEAQTAGAASWYHGAEAQRLSGLTDFFAETQGRIGPPSPPDPTLGWRTESRWDSNTGHDEARLQRARVSGGQKTVVSQRIRDSVRGVPEGIGMRDEGQFREVGSDRSVRSDRSG
ncbi:hypothetical protein SBV1_2740007 [Verrucomicrobia bacterium]|nr:hypothetical protein SBV1_2740007 [Verrucomicrobiota bacterium]